MENQTGARKLITGESVIIFDKVREPSGSTDREAESLTSDKIGSTPTKNARRKHGKLSKKDALGISRAGVKTVQETGIDVSIINLPNNSFAVVYHASWACVKCSNFFPGMPELGNVCEVCRVKALDSQPQ